MGWAQPTLRLSTALTSRVSNWRGIIFPRIEANAHRRQVIRDEVIALEADDVDRDEMRRVAALMETLGAPR